MQNAECRMLECRMLECRNAEDGKVVILRFYSSVLIDFISEFLHSYIPAFIIDN
jgi:hypothetical protein